MALQALIIALTRSLGFTAISDDDYARLVIAQEFAAAPTLDPSGTSWLPFPFIATGSAMWLFGSGLRVGLLAQQTLSLAGAAGLYLAARNWGATRVGSILGAALGCLVPTAAFLASAPVPGFFTAALIVLGTSTLLRPRWLPAGGMAFLLACASRYEAWPAAGAFSAVLLFHTRKLAGAARGLRLASAGLALIFPLLWCAYGIFHHGGALFFVTRVENYKAALSSARTSWMESLLDYPRLILLAEPEIVFASLLTGAAAAWTRPGTPSSSRAPRGPFAAWTLLPFAALLLFLMIGAVRGGTPTHHPERPLLAIWLLAALSVGMTVELAFSSVRRAKWLWGACALALTVSVVFRFFDPWDRQPFAHRQAEQRIGEFIAQHLPRERIALSLPDYGYFAVMSSATMPSRFIVLQKNDPRETNTKRDRLRVWLAQDGNCTYVTRRDHLSVRPHVIAVEGDLMLARKLTCPATRLSD
jgi:hypothetical protein